MIKRFGKMPNMMIINWSCHIIGAFCNPFYIIWDMNLMLNYFVSPVKTLLIISNSDVLSLSGYCRLNVVWFKNICHLNDLSIHILLASKNGLFEPLTKRIHPEVYICCCWHSLLNFILLFSLYIIYILY